MLTEMDVLNAWLAWHKAGRIPPHAASVNDLRRMVRNMRSAFIDYDRKLFIPAAQMLAQVKTKNWPTAKQIEVAILTIKMKAKVAQRVQ